MDEQTLNNQQQATTATDPQTPTVQPEQQTTPLATDVAAPPAENLPSGVSDYSAQIAQMYDAQLAAKQQSMEDAYNQNLLTMQRAREQIAPTYFNQGNDLATQYERTRRNNNMRADMNGLNTGTASQMGLAQQSNYLDAFGQIRTAQANAERQTDQQIADLEVAYKSQVAQALADNDYQKATALLQEYQRRDNAAEEMRRYNQQQAEADAKVRAAYGDFGGYADLYGQDVSNAMQQYWAFNNPDYAYSMGLITAAQYRQATGRSPAGSSSKRRSSGYRRNGGTDPNNQGPGTYDPNNPNGGSEEIDEDTARMLRRAGYSSDEKFYLGEMNRINLESIAEARAIAEKNGLKKDSDEMNRFVDAYAKNKRETDADYIANQNLYTSAKNTREADESAKRQAQYEQEKRNEPAETKKAQTAVQIEQNRRRLVEDNQKQTGENRTTSTAGTTAPRKTLAQILGLEK